MTIQLHLPDETVAVLIMRAQAQGRLAEELAAEALSALFTDVPAEDEATGSDALDRLRQGFADLDAGRTLSIQDAHSAFDASFQGRFGGSETGGGSSREGS